MKKSQAVIQQPCYLFVSIFINNAKTAHYSFANIITHYSYLSHLNKTTAVPLKQKE